jgi:AcrR family transcriptional regulator
VPASSHDKMVSSAAQLMSERGLSGTSFREVVEHSGAPRGSIYHHFPDGKFQLAEEAVRLAGAAGQALIAQTANADDPVAGLHAFLALWRAGLNATDFRAGCPVVAVVAESPATEPQLLAAAAAVFTAWCDGLATELRAAGLADDRARRLATTIVAAVEGAVVLCRAQRSEQPLSDVGQELELLLVAALPAAAG